MEEILLLNYYFNEKGKMSDTNTNCNTFFCYNPTDERDGFEKNEIDLSDNIYIIKSRMGFIRIESSVSKILKEREHIVYNGGKYAEKK